MFSIPERDDGVSSPTQDLATMLKSGRHFDLARAALLVSAEEYPDLDVEAEATALRSLATEGASRVDGLENFFARLDGLRRFLYEDKGFRGNLDDYRDPRNCFLNDVLERRLGIPLTLSIIHLTVARAAGFEARGVGLPGHFVIRVERAGRGLVLDPFHEGRIVSTEDCRELVKATTGRPWLFRPNLLDGTEDREIIGRMLLNLKHVYVGRKEYSRALSAVERLLLVRPDSIAELRDRGLIKAEMGLEVGAIQDLEAYLSASPDAVDRDSVLRRMKWLKRQVTLLN